MSTERTKTLTLLKELQKELTKLTKVQIAEASEKVGAYSRMLEEERRRRNK
jgi:hypothetical protein